MARRFKLLQTERSRQSLLRAQSRFLVILKEKLWQ